MHFLQCGLRRGRPRFDMASRTARQLVDDVTRDGGEGAAHGIPRSVGSWTRTQEIDPGAVSVQVMPGRPNLLTYFAAFSGPRPARHDTTRPGPARHSGSPSDPVGVRHPGKSKHPTAFPLVEGPSSVSTQSARRDSKP